MPSSLPSAQPGQGLDHRVLGVDLQHALGGADLLVGGLEDALQVGAHPALLVDEHGRGLGQARAEPHVGHLIAEQPAQPAGQRGGLLAGGLGDGVVGRLFGRELAL